MTVIVKDNGSRKLPFEEDRLNRYLDNIKKEFPKLNIESYRKKAIHYILSKDEYSVDEMVDYLIREAESRVDVTTPEWEFFAARLYLQRLYKKASKNRFYDAIMKYGSYVGLHESLAQRGIYSVDILEKYSREELMEAETFIDSSKDLLFTYNGLYLLATRYLATDEDKKVFELPQERWLTIALFLMQDEKENRMKLVEEAYWALSNLYMTVATPTLANAGKVGGQLSSCFIDTVDDSLQGIYDSNTDVARVSKQGGGVGVYIGNVRSSGAPIRGVLGASGGTVPWIKQLNNTAVSVDQLGARKGAITVTLDVFHKDIEAFLDLRLNNGDQRLRAHDIFTSVSIPDLFMEAVENRGEWYLFDPYEVKQKKGWYLQDYYDKEKGSGLFREKYEELIQDGTISKKRVKALDIMKRIMISQLETGTPFMFYRDTVNRANPNSHAGMIYASNLCQEIAQNMSATVVTEEIIDEDKIVVTKEAGDFVVCNLSSINLGSVFSEEDVIDRLVTIQVRMLDNVIELNKLPVPQALITNQKYRAVGLGTFGWHHLLAKKGIHWDSEEATSFADSLYERIAFHTIEASMKLAEEKGAYPYFKDSSWDTGEYFSSRNYTSDTWVDLAKKVKEKGIRNGYLMAVAPNMSTAQIAGSTASIDPIYDSFYYEEKKDYRRPVIAPELNLNTYAFYKSAYKVNQIQSVKQNGKRQRHVDQAISFNFYVPSGIKASKLLELHTTAWSEGLKTTYYVRSNDIDVEECEWCSS
ncbi:ribonucleotide-diphosphate reductase, alpha subunit [Listeria phage cka15]|nr:ribonucleotide-diphosphate reductase, alpha subunit [Listeria phage cka15]